MIFQNPKTIATSETTKKCSNVTKSMALSSTSKQLKSITKELSKEKEPTCQDEETSSFANDNDNLNNVK